MRRYIACNLTLTLLATISPGLRSQRAGPTYPSQAPSITVPFAMAVDFTHLDTTLKLLTGVNGGPAHAFTVDTGSVGVILPAVEIPGFDPTDPGNTPGELRYASSGLTLTGFWTRATVRFLNPETARSMAEATVHVLAVTKGSCQGGGANAGHCTGAIPHMLGVGFGRGGDAANGMRTEADNPFVNLTAMSTVPPSHPGERPRPLAPAQPVIPMRHGYLITQAGITFGLSGPETRGFQFVKLTPTAGGSSSLLSFRSVAKESASAGSGAPPAAASSPRVGSQAFSLDYQTAPGFLTLGTHTFPMGAVLIDTGLTNMIVEEPNQPTSGDLPAGQPATVHLLGGQLLYRFTTGSEATPVSPRRATWAAYTHGPFVNTGLRALACFDYLYDADNGYLGLRPTCAAK